jgi:hypothetical protein
MVATSVRLGVARLRLLAAEEADLVGQIRSARAGVRGPAAELPTQGGRALVKLSAIPGGAAEQPGAHGIAKARRALVSRRADMRECAEFLTLNVVALGTIVSLLATTVVDQGLMSSRLTAFTGIVLGTLAAAWSIYRVSFRIPVGYVAEALPDQEVPATAKRRKVRLAHA